MNYVLTRLKIKPGKLPRVKQFLRELTGDRKNMEALLAELQIKLDCSFVVEEAAGSHLYIFKVLAGPTDVPAGVDASTKKIAADIASWGKDCFDERDDLSALAVFGSLSKGQA